MLPQHSAPHFGVRKDNFSSGETGHMFLARFMLAGKVLRVQKVVRVVNVDCEETFSTLTTLTTFITFKTAHFLPTSVSTPLHCNLTWNPTSPSGPFPAGALPLVVRLLSGAAFVLRAQGADSSGKSGMVSPQGFGALCSFSPRKEIPKEKGGSAFCSGQGEGCLS